IGHRHGSPGPWKGRRIGKTSSKIKPAGDPADLGLATGQSWSWILPRAFTKGNQSGPKWCTPVGRITSEMHLAHDDSRPKGPPCLRHAGLTQERKTEGTGKSFPAGQVPVDLGPAQPACKTKAGHRDCASDRSCFSI